jgi:hypothetical protein
VTVPETIAVTTPNASIDAVSGLLLAHVPPGVAELSVAVLPGQALVVPVIASGAALTVTTDAVWQPVGSVYVIMLVPAARPLTIPVSEPMVATDNALLLHVPPSEVLLNVPVAPAHTLREPPIADGNGLTVTVSVVEQPVPIV